MVSRCLIGLSNIENFESLAEEAKQIYQVWLAKKGFQFRNGQADMIGFLANTLSGQKGKRIGVVEAGTGTGKTIAYCIPHILAAKRLKKTVVIATSTVLLQEQLLNSELKDLSNLIPGGFTYGLLKGRQRYACIERIDEHANPKSQSEPNMFDEFEANSSDQSTARRLLAAFQDGRWDGNMDLPPQALANHQRNTFTTDARSCLGSKCTHLGDCPYFEARKKIFGLDVVVVNYSLLLTLLRAGVDALPETNNCLYVFDEAHKLEEIVTNTGMLSSQESAVTDHAAAAADLVNKLLKHVRGDNPIADPCGRIQQVAPRVSELEDQFKRRIDSLIDNPDEFIEKAKTREEKLRFKGGLVDSRTRSLAQQMAVDLGTLHNDLEELSKRLNPKQDAQEITWIAKKPQRQAILKVAKILQSVDSDRALFEDWGSPQPLPAARWFDSSQRKVPYLTVPININSFLQETIWSQAYSVTCTSATLVSSNGFDHFKNMVGLSSLDNSQFKRIASPFNYKECVQFVVPKIPFSRPGGNQFNLYASKALSTLLDKERSALVLFNSRWDMKAVYKAMPKKFKERCLVQDEDGSVGAILEKHRTRVDQGAPSVILGLVSFREGVDLPGEYCEHVVIMRLPFDPPGDPVRDAKKEMLGLTDYNSFMGFDVPDASMKLAQACGRLIRNENDRGTITVFDRRLVDARYGSSMLKALPDFQVRDLSVRP